MILVVLFVNGHGLEDSLRFARLVNLSLGAQIGAGKIAWLRCVERIYLLNASEKLVLKGISKFSDLYVIVLLLRLGSITVASPSRPLRLRSL